MKFSTLSKAGFAASVCAALTAMSTGVHAGTLQDTIFAKVDPSARDRMFFRLSYINAHVKTTSGATYDVTGPVYTKGDAIKYLDSATSDAGYVSMFNSGGVPLSDKYEFPISTNLDDKLDAASADANCASLAIGLGTPCGIKGRASSTLGTAALSLGYYFDDDYKWAVEAFVLAAPLKSAVYGVGNNQLNGKKIIETKLLPPIVTLGRYFGDKKSWIKPYLGLAASYAVFYDTKATEALNVYQGGGSLGDTTVRLKNGFGFGPMAGLKIEPEQSGWHFSLNVGKIRYKTEASITTNNTHIDANSAVLQDYGALMSYNIVAGSNVFRQFNTNGTLNSNRITVATTGTPEGFEQGQFVPLVTAVMCDLAKAKYGSNSCNQGTFVRRNSNTLDNTMFVFSVGRNF